MRYVPHSRNLTDEQLAAIRETGGLVGINFASSFLRSDGRQDANTPAELIVNHIEHLLEHLGEDSVGFGSDFDGAKFLRAYKMLRTSESGDTDANARIWSLIVRKDMFQELATCVETNLGGDRLGHGVEGRRS